MAVEEVAKICSNCTKWYYGKQTEVEYGMGIGVCMDDGSTQFCQHSCIFCDLKEEDEEDWSGFNDY